MALRRLNNCAATGEKKKRRKTKKKIHSLRTIAIMQLYMVIVNGLDMTAAQQLETARRQATRPMAASRLKLLVYEALSY